MIVGKSKARAQEQTRIYALRGWESFGKDEDPVLKFKRVKPPTSKKYKESDFFEDLT